MGWRTRNNEVVAISFHGRSGVRYVFEIKQIVCLYSRDLGSTPVENVAEREREWTALSTRKE